MEDGEPDGLDLPPEVMESDESRAAADQDESNSSVISQGGPSPTDPWGGTAPPSLSPEERAQQRKEFEDMDAKAKEHLTPHERALSDAVTFDAHTEDKRQSHFSDSQTRVSNVADPETGHRLAPEDVEMATKYRQDNREAIDRQENQQGLNDRLFNHGEINRFMLGAIKRGEMPPIIQEALDAVQDPAEKDLFARYYEAVRDEFLRAQEAAIDASRDPYEPSPEKQKAVSLQGEIYNLSKRHMSLGDVDGVINLFFQFRPWF